MRTRTKWTISLAMLVISGTAAAAYWRTTHSGPAIVGELQRAALDESNRAPYAELLRAERASIGRRATITVATPCFWSGEGRYGLLDGVYKTTPGYLKGQEVVRVEFDPALVSGETLVALADPGEVLPEGACKLNLAAAGASRADAELHPDDQPKFYLQQTELRFVPMTPAQQTRVNAYLHANRPIEPLLSPAQVKLWDSVRAHPGWHWKNYVAEAGM